MNKTVVYMGLIILIIGFVIALPISLLFYPKDYTLHLMIFFMGIPIIIIGIVVSIVGWRMKKK